MVYFSLFCLLKLILYNSKPQNKMWDWNQKVSVLFYKNVKSSISIWLTHLTLRFLYILGCSGPRCVVRMNDCAQARSSRPKSIVEFVWWTINGKLVEDAAIWARLYTSNSFRPLFVIFRSKRTYYINFKRTYFHKLLLFLHHIFSRKTNSEIRIFWQLKKTQNKRRFVICVIHLS